MEAVATVALCIICIKPDPLQVVFYGSLADKYDVYFVCDSVDLEVSAETHTHVKIIQISDDVCKGAGFINSATTTIEKTPIGWDKALYYFSSVIVSDKSYEHVWFLEDDVFVPAKNTLSNIDLKYGLDLGSGSAAPDLLIRGSKSYHEDRGWNWWSHIPRRNLARSYHEMICCVRMSSKLLAAIADYVKTNKQLYFIEVLFPTLAKNGGLNVKIIPELEFVYYRHDFTDSDIKADRIYHPVKDMKIQEAWRSSILSLTCN